MNLIKYIPLCALSVHYVFSLTSLFGAFILQAKHFPKVTAASPALIYHSTCIKRSQNNSPYCENLRLPVLRRQPYLLRSGQNVGISSPGRSLLQFCNLSDVIPLTSTLLPKTRGTDSQASKLSTTPPSENYETFPPSELWGSDKLLMSGCEANGEKMSVAVLLSGGVDSSLALRLLVAAGHVCTAFYLQIWFQEDFRNFWDACPWEEDLAYAKKVCVSLGVPLHVVPMTKEYWERVVSHSVSEIKDGRTPNPDMLCNSRVKFGAFYDYLEREHRGCFDRIASGHYARIIRSQYSEGSSTFSYNTVVDVQSGMKLVNQEGDSNNAIVTKYISAHNSPASYQQKADSAIFKGQAEATPRASVGLALTPDAIKDQTYFLAHLTPSQLEKSMFPLGALTKQQVRQLADIADLANKSRKDSQGICFLGKVKFNEFVKEHLGEWQGLLVESETGKILGLHQGYWFYTVGQRNGIKLAGGPWYVVRKDRDLNVVYASKDYYTEDKSRDTFYTGPINWVSYLRPDTNKPMYCKVRHGPSIYLCKSICFLSGLEGTLDNSVLANSAVKAEEEMGEHGAHVFLDGNDQGLAAGQFSVFYQDGMCLGSAKIL